MFVFPVLIYFEKFLNWLKTPITVTRFALYSFPYFLVFIVVGFLLAVGWFSTAGNSRTDDVMNGLLMFIIGLVIAIAAVRFRA